MQANASFVFGRFQRKGNIAAMAGYDFRLSDKYVLNPTILFIYHPMSGFLNGC